jgi:1-phosphofructokinase
MATGVAGYPAAMTIPGSPSGAPDPGRSDASSHSVCVFWPAPLLTITIEHQDRAQQVHLHAGGQGYWVARLVASLASLDVVACAPLGGEVGTVIGALCARAGVTLDAVEIHASNGMYVHDRRDGDRVVLAEGAPAVLDRHELDDLYTRTLARALRSQVCVICGTPDDRVLPTDVYRRLTADLGANGVITLADLSGEQLRAAVEGGLAVLKASDEEVVAGGWARDTSEAALIDAIRDLVGAGARDVVISRADAGSLAMVGGKLFDVRPPEMQVVEHRGAGDSMVGAFAAAIAEGAAPEDALRFGAAAGALNVTRAGLGSGERAAITALAERVTLEPLDG